MRLALDFVRDISLQQLKGKLIFSVPWGTSEILPFKNLTRYRDIRRADIPFLSRPYIFYNTISMYYIYVITKWIISPILKEL